MIIKKELLMKGESMYSLSVEKIADDFFNVVAQTNKRRIVRLTNAARIAAIDTFNDIVVQKHAEGFFTENFFESDRFADIESLPFTMAPKLICSPAGMDAHNFHSYEVPLKAERVFISVGYFNSGKIEIFSADKVLKSDFFHTPGADEFVVEAYALDNTYHAVKFLCLNDTDLAKANTKNIDLWLIEYCKRIRAIKLKSAPKATENSSKVVRINKNRNELDRYTTNGKINKFLVKSKQGNKLALCAYDKRNGALKDVGHITVPDAVEVGTYDVVQIHTPKVCTNIESQSLFMQVDTASTSKDCIFTLSS